MKIKLSFLLLLISAGAFAQNMEYRSSLCANMGISLVGSFMNVVPVAGGDKWEVDPWRKPAFGFTLDKSTKRWFSVGFAFSTQPMGFKIKVDTFTMDINNQKVPVIINAGININRLSFSFRPMFHYANKKNWDLYSGFRVGLTIWHLNVTSDNPDMGLGTSLKIDEWMNKNLNLSLSEILKKKSAYNITSYGYQMVLIGARVYLYHNIGINAELCIGSPHYLSFGLTYRVKSLKKAGKQKVNSEQ